MRNLINILAISAILLLSTHQAKADDETKRLIGGIAAGLVGMAINEMGKDDEAQATDVQWNEQEQQPKLQYRDDIAEAQLKLKKLGYYNGKIDGL